MGRKEPTPVDKNQIKPPPPPAPPQKATRIQVKISHLKCRYCDTENLQIENRGSCVKCGMNHFEIIYSRVLDIPEDILDDVMETEKSRLVNIAKEAGNDQAVCFRIIKALVEA